MWIYTLVTQIFDSNQSILYVIMLIAYEKIFNDGDAQAQIQEQGRGLALYISNIHDIALSTLTLVMFAPMKVTNSRMNFGDASASKQEDL